MVRGWLFAALAIVSTQLPSVVYAQRRLTPQEFHEGIQNGTFTTFVDVRGQDEWDAGHIENAFFASPDVVSALTGCQNCTIVVYCRSGARAGAAIGRLIAAGFSGPLYNGLGTFQWTAAGYKLSMSPSVVPNCVTSPGECMAPVRPQSPPKMEPITLQPQEFYEGMMNGTFTNVVDVRGRVEWNAGHIEGAFLGFPDVVAALAGCETCPIVVYCQSGARAGAAIQRLIAAGFQGQLYNGLGTGQWIAAGYKLSMSPSVAPNCVTNRGECMVPVQLQSPPTYPPMYPLTYPPSYSPQNP